MGAREIDFLFDIASPYSYLAATQLDGLAGRTGATVRWRPILLGAVLKDSGNSMPAAVAAKASYMVRDLERWAKRYGVPLRLSSHFPLNSLRAQRALLAAGHLAGEASIERFAMALFRAAWVDDRDIGTVDEIRAVAGEVGLDGAKILLEIDKGEIKDELKRVTADAVARGMFGAPAFLVGDELFWGNDRLSFVEDAALGGPEQRPAGARS